MGGQPLGHVTAGGRVDGYDLPTPGSEPHGLAVLPDGTVHAALESGAIAHLTPA
ncbi:hypothetical protein ABT344_13225 [Micromonospora carbonacea]|uniref:hypothetical protein n=1 Tax=Micromonospora carbonacea TaxID=47853 RepID=UPI00331C5F5C